MSSFLDKQFNREELRTMSEKEHAKYDLENWYKQYEDVVEPRLAKDNYINPWFVKPYVDPNAYLNSAHTPVVEVDKPISDKRREELTEYFKDVVNPHYDFTKCQRDEALEMFICMYHQMVGDVPVKKWIEQQRSLDVNVRPVVTVLKNRGTRKYII